MRVLDLSSAPTPPDSPTPPTPGALPADTAVCLGTFDGMHRGHQGLIARARSLAGRVAVVTFEPRPADVLAPGKAAPRLQTPEQRVRVCRELGVDELVMLRFDPSVSTMSPQAFVQAFLLDGLAPAAVIVGYDFRFGARRAGGPEELRALLEPAGVRVSVVEKIEGRGELAGEKLGSTAIRRYVSEGQVERAARVLGRLYAVEGEVVHGDARGRGLGFPTANVAAASLLPSSGVYACFLTDLSDGDAGDSWAAVANLGTNPTFTGAREDAPLRLEVHALDVDLGERLYGRRVEVAFVDYIRGEQRFDGPQALREAIAADIARARPLLDAAAEARRHARPVAADAAPPPFEQAERSEVQP